MMMADIAMPADHAADSTKLYYSVCFVSFPIKLRYSTSKVKKKKKTYLGPEIEVPPPDIDPREPSYWDGGERIRET